MILLVTKDLELTKANAICVKERLCLV